MPALPPRAGFAGAYFLCARPRDRNADTAARTARTTRAADMVASVPKASPRTMVQMTARRNAGDRTARRITMSASGRGSRTGRLARSTTSDKRACVLIPAPSRRKDSVRIAPLRWREVLGARHQESAKHRRVIAALPEALRPSSGTPLPAPSRDTAAAQSPVRPCAAAAPYVRAALASDAPPRAPRLHAATGAA